MNEVWFYIPGYEGYYMVSNFGRVRSLDRYVKRSRGGLQIAKSTILKQNLSGAYLAVVLSKAGILKTFRVHRLVAEAYLGSLPKGKVVNHLDGNKLNNNAYNLELTTQQGNIKHAVANGLTKGYKQRRILNVK
jgi:hypothetical protein